MCPFVSWFDVCVVVTGGNASGGIPFGVLRVAVPNLPATSSQCWRKSLVAPVTLLPEENRLKGV